MITVGGKQVVLTGIQIVSGVNYVMADNTVVTSQNCMVLDKNGNLVSPLIAGVVTEQPHTFVGKETIMVTGRTMINGDMSPVNQDVHVSLMPTEDKRVLETLIETCIDSTKANEEGKFSFDLYNDGENKNVVVWSEITSDFSTASSADMDLSVTYESNIEPMLAKRYFSFVQNDVAQMSATEPVEQTDSTEPTIEYTLYGKCPSDAKLVHVSAPTSMPEDDAELLLELENSLVVNISANDGSYYATYTINPFEPDVSYCVWCESIISTDMTANFTSSTGDVEPVCLAGDTAIMLCDGTQKALRDLTADDILMSGDGTPTRIVQIKRGGESVFHTLYYFSDGTIIDEAHRHRFYNVDAGHWKYLDEWKIGDHARHYNGYEPRLVRIEHIDEPCMRYGLWTESHDYFANGLLSGETAANQSILSDASLEQVVEMLSSLSPDKLEKLYKGELG